MTGDQLPDNDHFARYCRPQQIRKGRPAVSAFVPRTNEDHLSVNWLEFFDADPLGVAVARVREDLGAILSLGVGGRFAVLNVGAAKSGVLTATGHLIRIEHAPLGGNLSHAGIYDYPTDLRAAALELRELATAQNVYPAVVT